MTRAFTQTLTRNVIAALRWRLLRLGYPLAVLVLALGTAASLWGWRTATERLQTTADAEFDRFATLTFTHVRRTVEHHNDLLASFAALFRAGGTPTRGDFHRHFNDLRVLSRFPGVQAVQFSRLVGDHERDGFEARIRADRSLAPDGHPAYTIHPAGRRPSYVAVEFNEPMLGNEAAFGFDSLGQPMRRDEVERARDGGQAVISPPIRLLQGQIGWVARLPVYRHGQPATTPEQRRQAYLGQVSGVFRADALLAEAVSNEAASAFQVSVIDGGLMEPREGEPLPERRLLTRAVSTIAGGELVGGDAADRRETMIEVGGRIWTIEVIRMAPNFAFAPLPLVLLATGLGIAMLLAGFVARAGAMVVAAETLADQLSAKARAGAARMEAMLRSAAFGITMTDADGVIQVMNPAAERLLRVNAAEVLHQRRFADFVEPGAGAAHAAATDPAGVAVERLREKLATQESLECEMHLLRGDSSRVPVSLTVSALRENGALTGYLHIAYDISERRQLHEHMSQLAYNDGLTGLPNRLQLERNLELALVTAAARGDALALLFIDLDRFKPINDTHGHAVGDHVLCEVAKRLKRSIRSTDTAARIGGDEFVVLLTHLNEPADSALVADKLLTAISEPMDLLGLRLQVGASIGLVTSQGDEQDAETLLKSADQAMYRAKQAGRGKFSPSLSAGT